MKQLKKFLFWLVFETQTNFFYNKRAGKTITFKTKIIFFLPLEIIMRLKVLFFFQIFFVLEVGSFCEQQFFCQKCLKTGGFF
jgi:hypothetical protein